MKEMKKIFCLAGMILLVIIMSACSLAEKLQAPYEISNPVCKSGVVYFDFYNDSSKEISLIQINISLCNKQSGEIVGPARGLISCEYKGKVLGAEKKEMCISVENYFLPEEEIPQMEILSLVICRIVYADGSVWRDLFGLYDAVTSQTGKTPVQEVLQPEPDTTAESEPTTVPEPVEGPEEDPTTPPDPTTVPDPTAVPEPVEGPEDNPIEQETPPDPIPEIPEPKKMTLLIYMAADNDLESYAIQNLKAMEHANFQNMNILVLLDRAEAYDETNDAWTDTRLFELVHDETDSNFIISKRLDCPILGISATSQTELDMGNFNVLRNFITYAKNEYEAEKYSLIIWGHGTGWRYSALPENHVSSRAVAIDDKSGTYMSVSQMGRALKNQGLCVIGFDTCFAGVFENVYEIRNCAAFTVASPGVSPSAGWDYRYLLEDLSECSFTPKEIARIMAECSLVNTTIFDNSKLYDVMEKFEAFAQSLAEMITNATRRNSILDDFTKIKSYSYRQYPCDLFIDMRSMADYYSCSENNNLAQASKNLHTAIDRSASTTNTETAQIGLHLIPLIDSNVYTASHSIDYKKDYNKADQCMFIKESQWWVPSLDGTSQSLLDKLFYWNY